MKISCLAWSRASATAAKYPAPLRNLPSREQGEGGPAPATPAPSPWSSSRWGGLSSPAGGGPLADRRKPLMAVELQVLVAFAGSQFCDLLAPPAGLAVAAALQDQGPAGDTDLSQQLATGALGCLPKPLPTSQGRKRLSRERKLLIGSSGEASRQSRERALCPTHGCPPRATQTASG